MTAKITVADVESCIWFGNAPKPSVVVAKLQLVGRTLRNRPEASRTNSQDFFSQALETFQKLGGRETSAIKTGKADCTYELSFAGHKVYLRYCRGAAKVDFRSLADYYPNQVI